jgi:CBS-domain-containing membrane protein
MSTGRLIRDAALAGIGSALAIGVMELLSIAADYPMAAIPFATSIVLVIALPDAAPSRPRALVGGHLVATIVGLIVVNLSGAAAWSAALAVGLAVAAMVLTRTLHPPAGINPLLVVSGHLPWSYLIVPVCAGALLLLLFAYIWHRAVRRDRWPESWT